MDNTLDNVLNTVKIFVNLSMKFVTASLVDLHHLGFYAMPPFNLFYIVISPPPQKKFCKLVTVNCPEFHAICPNFLIVRTNYRTVKL
jgi:hypothetical protein